MSGPAFESLTVPTHHELVNAGAGAGKTYTLAHKALNVAAAIMREGRAPRLVLTTFTRKAASELRERIMQYAIASGRPELVDFVNTRSQLLVSTIHGIAHRFLQRYGSELGLDAGYQLVGAAEAHRLGRRVLRQVAKLDAEARAQVSIFGFEGVLERLQMISRARATQTGLQPWSATEVSEIYQSEIDRLEASGRRLARGFLSETGAWAKLGEDINEVLVRFGEKNWSKVDWAPLEAALALPRGKSTVTAEQKEIFKDWRKQVFELCTDPSHAPELWSQFADEFAKLNVIAETFERELIRTKLSSGQIEIDDLERMTLRLCRRAESDEPSAAALAFSMEWDYWMIDEFQDTSPLQLEILKYFSWKRPHFKVGDPQQSIYQFRGARSEIFHREAEGVEVSGGKLHRLTVNRRSRPAVLEFINEVFRPHEQFQPMLPHPAEEDDAPAATLALGLESDAAELAFILKQVQIWKASGVKWSQIAVLGRTHDILSQIAKELRAYSIPYTILGGAEFYRRQEIQDLVAFLRFALAPDDLTNTIAVLRAFAEPDDELTRLVRNKISIWAQLRERKDARSLMLQTYLKELDRLGVANALIQFLIQSKYFERVRGEDRTGRSEANIWKFISILNQQERSAGFSLNSFINDRRGPWFRVDPTSDADLPGEQNFISLMTIHASKGLEFDYVLIPQLQKGLAHDNAALVVVDEPRQRWGARLHLTREKNSDACLPMKQTQKAWQQRQIEESERLFYVALTRAKKALCLTATEKGRKAGAGSFLFLLNHLNLQGGRHELGSTAWYQVEDSGLVETIDPLAIATSELKPREPYRAEAQKKVETQSVTSLLAEAAVNFSRGSDVVQITERADRGTRVHRLLETLKYPSREILQTVVESWFPDQSAEVLSALRFVQNNETLAAVLESGEVEWGFSFKSQGLTIDGQIDMFGRDLAGRLWIIDYKTGDASHVERAFEQLRLYSQALLAAGLASPGEDVTLAAVFPFESKISHIDIKI